MTTTLRLWPLFNSPEVFRRFPGGYQEGDRVTPSAFHLEIEVEGEPDHRQAADRAFAYFNRDDRPNGRVERSLSIGDVVLVEEVGGRKVYLACEELAWREVEEPRRVAP